MFGKIGVIVCIFFIAVTLAEYGRANPVIGKRNQHNFKQIRLVNGKWIKWFKFLSSWNVIQNWCLILDSAGDFDMVGICLRNCAQCKKMYGSYFEGQMCADGCVKFKGKVIPGTWTFDSLISLLFIVLTSLFEKQVLTKTLIHYYHYYYYYVICRLWRYWFDCSVPQQILVMNHCALDGRSSNVIRLRVIFT